MRCDQKQSKKLALRTFIRGGVLAAMLFLAKEAVGLFQNDKHRLG